MDHCYFCRGKVIEKKIEHLHRWGNALFMVKGLPAEVCEDCKEVYLPPASLRMLDDLLARHENPTEFIQIPVYSLS
ncbi:MAG: YgiT-type zinc finger protein [Candidatus Rokubacteria bacterium]|jgi:YgiT-type zinc finger domain-containing protein|nr:YgiT-type zinc finger protein [Candidatus Rokubacteria bacterium]